MFRSSLVVVGRRISGLRVYSYIECMYNIGTCGIFWNLPRMGGC